MVMNGRPLKRMKRRVTADLFDFLNFPASISGGGSYPDGPFRLNIRSFLSKHAQLPPPSSLFPHLLTWQIVFRIGELVDGPDSSPAVIALDVVEEDVTRSRSVYCDQCRVVGWSGHPVCGKRYHFIIRADNNSVDGYHKSCTSCGDLVHLSEPRCKSCNYVMTAEDLEDWVYLQLEDTTHLLHGVVHSNGYGHLLRVNGRESGSRFLSGCDIMDFWDRFCRTLGVRKVSVMDVSKKYGLEFRLLHAVTNGLPWYGDWGFEFGSGSFALTVDAYRKAVDTLSNVPINLFLSQARKPRMHLQDVISFYQAMSESELVTTRDLFRFLMKLIHDAKQSVLGRTCSKDGSSNSMVLCTWTVADIDCVEQAMIKVLRAVGVGSNSRWVTWRTLRGAVTKVGSPELLDYCLKDVVGKLTSDGMAVCSRCNPDTDTIEYRLEPVSVEVSNSGDSMSVSSSCLSEDHLLRDLKFLFDSLLHRQTMVNYRPQSTRELALGSASKLLDCKQFVKDYAKCGEKTAAVNPFAIRLSCLVELLDHPKDYTAPPPELIVLPLNATIADLKVEATKAFQEVYVLFRRFQAEELLDYGCVDDSTHVKFLVGLGGSIRVRGRCLGKHGLRRFRMERGIESWTVDCTCGAKDDDGERMLACDTCGVWQHTRCAGIDDLAAVPARFICGRCELSLYMTSQTSKGGRQCKDETSTATNVGFENNLTMSFGVR